LSVLLRQPLIKKERPVMMPPVLHIGPIRLQNFLVFAPLAGISDLPMRLLAKEAGCALVYSEMISANGLVYGSKKTKRLLDSDPAERPLSVQIFGSDPAIMRDAARIVADSGADILDINFGCSVRKILKSGAGAALMKSFKQAQAVIQAVCGAVKIPVTIKMRSGWDSSGEDALTIAKIAEASGVAAVAIHPRTASQGFRGQADWSIIQKVKSHTSLTVIGNGDIRTPPDVIRMKSETGCDAVMIGRAAIGYPWIFSQAMAAVSGNPAPDVGAATRMNVLKRYVTASIAHYGEKHACYMMRSRLGWFVKGLPHAGRFRESIKTISSAADAAACLAAYEGMLNQETAQPL
jgi:tRNA-dihydrouridine synthase B